MIRRAPGARFGYTSAVQAAPRGQSGWCERHGPIWAESVWPRKLGAIASSCKASWAALQPADPAPT